MKKYLCLTCSLIVGLVMISSCSKDDDDVSQLEKNYVNVQNATYQNASFPKSTTTEKLEGVSVSSSAKANSSDVITIVTRKPYKRFFIGVKNVPGYWVYTPKGTRSGDDNEDNDDESFYEIPFNFGDGTNDSFTLLISGEDEDGETTEPYEQEINYVDVASDKTTGISWENRYPLFEMQYDGKGRLVGFTNNWDEENLKISYNPLTMIITGDEETETISMSTNSKGYVTSASYKYESDWGESYTGNATFQYDSEGHLVSEKYTDDEGTSSIKFTWSNGDIIRSEVNYEDGERRIITGIYGEDNNVAQQGTLGLCIMRVNGYACFTDLFGVQCKHLPVSITITGNDSDWENGVRTFEYDFNTDGTVKIECYSEPNESPMKLYYSYGGTRMMSKGEDDFTFSSTYQSRLKRSVLSHFRTHFLQM